jgi:hypothetical protein
MADGQNAQRLILVCGATGNQGVRWREASSTEAFRFVRSHATHRSRRHRP